MKRIFPAILSVMLVSCVNSGTTAPEGVSGRRARLFESLEIDSEPGEMPDGARVALEASAIKIVAAGEGIVPAMLADLEARRDPYRRAVLVRLLARILDRIPSDSASRPSVDAKVRTASARLLSSEDPGDRLLGLQISALPKRTGLVEAALRLLDGPYAANRHFAILTLSRVAQTDLGYNPNAAARDRRAAVRRWKRWWSRNKHKAVYHSHAPAANPVAAAFSAEATAIVRRAGPYALVVTDRTTGEGVDGAVVVYSYYFTTLDGRGKKKQERSTTDANGKMLLAAETVVGGMQYIGADLIVSKAGYRQEAVRLMPHILTPNSYRVAIALEPE